MFCAQQTEGTAGHDRKKWVLFRYGAHEGTQRSGQFTCYDLFVVSFSDLIYFIRFFVC